VTYTKPDEIRNLILSCLENSSSVAGLSLREMSDDFDMLEEGIIDSIGFMRLIAELEERLGVRIDFDGLDPTQLTVVGSLSRHIAEMNVPRETP
jgi:acyl carrier protein